MSEVYDIQKCHVVVQIISINNMNQGCFLVSFNAMLKLCLDSVAFALNGSMLPHTVAIRVTSAFRL